MARANCSEARKIRVKRTYAANIHPQSCTKSPDYTASKTTLSVTVSGVSALSNISCQVLDASNNLATKNSAVTFSGSTLTITKPKSNDYGAYLVTFTPTLK